MQSTNQESVCRFSDEIVTYLYDEFPPREKTSFENHLAQCPRCVAEIADFSSIKTAFADWREAEFVPLNLPEILIPYQSKPAKLLTVEPKISVFDKIRAAFALRPVWQIGGAACAVLFVCFAAVLFAVKFSNQEQTANLIPVENNRSTAPRSTAPAPTVEVASTQTAPVSVEKSAPVSGAKSDAKIILTGDRQPNRKEANQTVKTRAAPVKTPKSLINVQNNQETMAVNTVKSVKAPHLSVDDDDEISDNSLRLSELFDETDK